MLLASGNNADLGPPVIDEVVEKVVAKPTVVEEVTNVVEEVTQSAEAVSGGFNLLDYWWVLLILVGVIFVYWYSRK